MNSDEQLDRLLDSVEVPPISNDFHTRLFRQTAPGNSEETGRRGWLATLFAMPRMRQLSLATAATLMAVTLAIGFFNRENPAESDFFLSDDEATELLWFFADEETEESEIDEIALLDSGVAELYALHD
jgi:hypothetical protein